MAEPLGERKKYGLETALSLRLSDSGHVPLACAPRRAYLSSLIISRLPKQKLPVRLDRQFFICVGEIYSRSLQGTVEALKVL